MNTEVVQAWREVKGAVHRLATLTIDANNFAHIESIAHAEAEEVIREAADKWDDANGLRRIVTRVGLNSILDFAKHATSIALRKYLRGS